MHAEIIGACVAASISVEASNGIDSASLKGLTKNIPLR